jgi:hypothetical protein
MTTMGRKSAMRSPATHTGDPVMSLMWSVSATAAMYVPKLEPAVARKSNPKAGERRIRPRRLDRSTTVFEPTSLTGG